MADTAATCVDVQLRSYSSPKLSLRSVVSLALHHRQQFSRYRNSSNLAQRPFRSDRRQTHLRLRLLALACRIFDPPSPATTSMRATVCSSYRRNFVLVREYFAVPNRFAREDMCRAVSGYRIQSARLPYPPYPSYMYVFFSLFIVFIFVSVSFFPPFAFTCSLRRNKQWRRGEHLLRSP